MNRARAAGLALFIIGAFYLTRSSRLPTHSTVGIVVGCLLMAVGLFRIITARPTPLR